LPRAAKNITSADHDRNLHAQGVHIFQFAGDGLNRFSVDAESLGTLKRFSGKLQQDSFVRWLVFFHGSLTRLLRRCHESPFAPSEITGIVTNYLRHRTIGVK
jgi:hypothetical protein